MLFRVLLLRRCVFPTVALSFAALVHPLMTQTPANANPDIFEALAPSGIIPSRLNLTPAKRTHAIKALIAARSSAGEEKRQEIAYLLATLGYEYQRNRDELLEVLKGCSHEIPTSGCDDMTGDYLMKLYLQGHKELLRPLLAAYPTGNVALQEGLGGFIGDRLAADTREFLAVASTFPPRAQQRICMAAGSEDGGGMPPKDFARVMRNLKAVGGEVAERCEEQVLAAKKDAEDNERQSAKH